MKKFKLSIIAFASLASASIALAGNSLSDYYTSQHPKTNTAVKNLLHPPTDITVINASSSYIFVHIPGTNIMDLLNPGYNDHIYNWNGNVWYTPLQLQDPYHSAFYNGNMCRLSIVTVYGNPGHYRINTDDDLCK